MTTVKERQTKLIVLAAVFSALATVAFALRMVNSRNLRRTLKIHDYFVGLSLVWMTSIHAQSLSDDTDDSSPLAGASAGAYGQNVLTVDYPTMTTTLKTFWSSEWFFITGTTAFRLGIIFLYIELFRGNKFYWISMTVAGIVIAYWVASVLMVLLLCRPIASNWDIKIQGKCGDVSETENISASFNLVVDLIVVTLPMPMVFSLNMPKDKKISVVASFLLGFITAGVNIGRLIQTQVCDPKNKTFCLNDASILVAAELSSGTIVACAPMIGAVILRRSRRRESNPRSKDPRIHTIGSSGRSWPRRDPGDIELLASQDDEHEKAASHRTQVSVPEISYQIDSGSFAEDGRGYNSAGIMVQNVLTIERESARV
ncbi:hypothetical protein N7468_000018 [Penicillium chermesinum]|uniref:Rhodopsin domain-containing protein n=1 Tax=Penicillium chermesinum TaxID=63820 RepID=A0A9W9PJH2_9EURO|nr:uncharacterized protein N7468_000018 [Penicillium chermesinum]KAJ5248567.1 hypothetical protein N7468_000018 [Penicillium chermesinum]KAJ6150681.1 hypothetical protein N7470_007275 [Penicillium chermesinum]